MMGNYHVRFLGDKGGVIRLRYPTNQTAETYLQTTNIKNMNNKSFFMTSAILVIAMSSLAQVTGTFTDSRDGKIYKTIKIGTQTWMAENLAFKSDSGCWAYNDDTNKVKIYGYLYDWESAKSICPAGWHLPNSGEWEVLSDYWKKTNSLTNSGFNVLLSGSRDQNGIYSSIGLSDVWWTSGGNTAIYGLNNKLSFYYFNILYNYYSKNCGFRVRCLKD
jgi:hypothetical protein